jgi:protoporphyrinogen oxidase
MPKKAIIIGAGPAGLTAAYEFLKRTDIQPVILEKSGDIGGISKTIEYKGNRLDTGPHRLFSKSDKVMDWWLNIMPLEQTGPIDIHYQNRSREVIGNGKQAKQDPEKVMLVVHRLSRIYFLRTFFSYPLQLSVSTLRTLGLPRTIRIMTSFFASKVSPRKPEATLEDFLINRFGQYLYIFFFKDYTEKVWGVPCSAISAEWGAARVKGVSLQKVLVQAFREMLKNKKKGRSDIGQKGKEVSMLEQFLYPRRGPGSLWEEVARQIKEMGGTIILDQDVQGISLNGKNIHSVETIDSKTKLASTFEGDYFLSSMPVDELVSAMGSSVPPNVREVAAGLQFRDFINVGVLLKHFSALNKKTGKYDPLTLKDTWLYIQESDVKVGRLMIYNNWGDGMIKDPKNTWVGMEYFCYTTDEFWALDDNAIARQAIAELETIGLARSEDVLDVTVRRAEKTYPAYFGTYDRFAEIREFADRYDNLFLVGRNGMHKYNNSDHSMLTAMQAVDNIADGTVSKENIWAISADMEYSEEDKDKRSSSHE